MTAIRLALLGAMAGGLAAQSGKDSCVSCHGALEGPLAEPTAAFEADVHKARGFSCVDCHGGDPTALDPVASMNRARGFKGKIDRRATPGLCARCHNDATLIHRFNPRQRVDQLAQYRTSVHGRRLAAGDTRVANCVDCHGVHDIREVRDPLSPVHPLRLPATCARCHSDSDHMKGYGIATDQFEKYRRSVHWEALSQRGDLSAPTCAACHGNHGAAPPGVPAVAHVCGSCHAVFENLFAKSPHKKAFDGLGIPGCVVCHGNHEVARPTVALVGVRPGSLCLNCHVEGEKGYQSAEFMRSRIDELATALDRSEGILKRAERSGMEVSPTLVEFSAGRESLIRAKVELHGFDSVLVDGSVKKGLEIAAAAHRVGEKALQERDFRRKGLLLSLTTIAVTMAGLWLALRELERPSNKT